MIDISKVDERKIILSYVIVVFCLILFLVFTHFFWPDFDEQVINLVGRDRGKSFSVLMTFIGWWGFAYGMVLPVLLASIVLFATSYRREALFTLSAFIAGAINVILKLLINRPRPHPE